MKSWNDSAIYKKNENNFYVMFRRIISVLLLTFLAISISEASTKSDVMKPRWMTSSLPKSKSPGYIFILSQGSGNSIEEARHHALVNLTSKLEHERGLLVSSSVRIEKISERNTAPIKNQSFTLEASEKGKRLNLTCRVIDEYWEYSHDNYIVTNLYTVNDNKQPQDGSYSDNICLTTNYGVVPMFYSLIPGAGQFYKGSNLKGGLILGGTVAGAAAIVLCENQRAEYAKKMMERPQNFDFYRNKKSNWTTGRNVAIGVTAVLYAYNLVDALLAPGRRRVEVSGKRYDYTVVPVLAEDSFGVTLALNF